MKKIIALLLTFCVLSTACQSTNDLSKDLVAMEISHATYVCALATAHVVANPATHVLESVAKQATSTLESANNCMDENKNIDAKNSNDKTDVLSVVQEGQRDSRGDLISIKITSDKNDTTALLFATSKGNTKKEKALLATNLKPRDNKGKTALTLAAFHGQTEMFTALIDASADMQVKNSASDTPVGTTTISIADYKEITAFMLSSKNCPTTMWNC